MTFLSTNSIINQSSALPQSQQSRPSLSCVSSSSASPSPTSSRSSSSFSSLFDTTNPFGLRPRPSGDSTGQARRESQCSATSWGSMGEGNILEGGGEKDVEGDNNHDDANTRSPPSPPRNASTGSIQTVSSTSSSNSDPALTTPDLSHHDQLPAVLSPHEETPSSPSDSTTSTALSKGESTPRAELPPPVWPLSAASPRRQGMFDEPMTMVTDGSSTVSRNPSLKRASSWRKKHASLDTPPTTPHHHLHDPSFPNFTTLKGIPPLDGPSHTASKSAPPPPPSSENPHPKATPTSVKRLSGESGNVIAADKKIIAHSPATGCHISAPLSPPAGYPLPSFHPGGRRHSSTTSSTRSLASSGASISSSSSSSKSTQLTPPPPRWAQPPTITNSISGRALSFGSAQSRPDISFDDFDPELFEGKEDEWIEIIKGMEGRIAIKSTPELYDIMVWLPGFSLDNITIATRGHRTIHIVADQWDEGDHAQWDIKLGEDANLKSVNAKFTGKELRVTVAREQRRTYHNPKSRSFRSEPSTPAVETSLSAPSITATSGHNPIDQAFAQTN
ncbi:hypothetical protein IAR55_002998 [Kwoniella newhampshirensis]|uniref:SHSP domain-containing protein n=1 Tax=Kwoniella newhampshirensis TaxID=1651941 RepID=A0AAW0Z073_9TREE